MMNNARTILSDLYQSQVHPKETIVNYFYRLNEAGKINGDKKSIVDIPAVLFTLVEEMEKKIEVYDANFKEIESILSKLVDKKMSDKPVAGFRQVEYNTNDIDRDLLIKEGETEENTLKCPICKKVAKSKLGLQSHKRSHK